ncbi:MAG: NAD(P)/FAD-dependent oxidoreductase, partial [Nitrospirae bacterium]
MKRVLVLGAGTGGTIVANMLTRELDLREWEVAVVDSAEEHHYQPGNLFIPFRLYGYEGREDVARPIRKPLSSKVRFVKGAVRAIDTEARRVECDGERLDYDFLVTALGCRLAPEEVEGLGPALGEGAIHTFYDLDHALAMQEPLARMESGRLVVDIADTPIKCPPAPIEFAFLADSFFRKKGVRDRIQITLVTPYAGAFTKPNTNRVLSQVAQEKGIEVVPNFLLASVDPEGRTIRSYGGEEVPFDLLCIVPPNLGPDVIEESGLGDGAGYCLTDPRTLRHRKAERVYVIGDVANIPTSKAGSVAHFEAET